MATNFKRIDFAAISAPADGTAVDTRNLLNHTFAVTVAAINTNVIVGVSGSPDGTNYAECTLQNTAVANLAITANRATITANGTYLLQVSGKFESMLLDWISETGGTAATVAVKYVGGN